MSVIRACLPCRTAKAKCDLIRPACGRCRQRGLSCSGFPADTGLLFRNENDAAQRNSERARRGPGRGSVRTASFEIIQSQSSAAIPEEDVRLYYPWLNEDAIAEIPEPLKQDLETRAVERFFINWTLYPSNHGVSPGHMHDLPMLYLGAPSESVLWFAVRALAFADMRDESTGNVPFIIKARQYYGAALSRTREIVHDKQNLANDRVLAAILLIDNFESMYLARTEPLGPHSEAVKHILRARGDGQLFDSSKFALWRLAHHRLQARQILLREQPEPEQIAWMSKLNLDRPDFHICGDILHMNILSAAARRLTQSNEDIDVALAGKLEQATELVNAIQVFIESIESWTSEMTEVWRPKVDDPHNIAQPWEMGELPSFPIPRFKCPQMLSYDDIWLAYMWNFHGASQIVLRESLVEVINYRAILQGQEGPDVEDTERIQTQQNRVEFLSGCIIRSFPMLLGFTHRHERGPRSLPQGKMAGRFFSLFSMWVVQRAQFTSDEHKQTASEVTAWIESRHGLG